MNAQDKHAILDEIDATLRAIGQDNYEQFRLTIAKAAVLFGNAAVWSKRLGDATRKDLEDAIEKIPDDEAPTKLGLMVELRNYLPTLGTILIRGATKVFPSQVGGAPRKLKDRDAERQACNLVLSLIAGGKAESEAKKIAAKQLEISSQTMNRRWAQRAVIMQPSIEEFLVQLLKSLSTGDGRPIVQMDKRVLQVTGEHMQNGTEMPDSEATKKKQDQSDE